MGKGKGGETTTTSKIELDPEIKRAAMANLDYAREVAALPPIFNNAPRVAGLTPQQLAAMQNINNAAGAFNMPGAAPRTDKLNPSSRSDQEVLLRRLLNLPLPKQGRGGVDGYSFEATREMGMRGVSKPMRALINSFFTDPETGAPPTNPSVQTPKSNRPKKKRKRSNRRSKQAGTTDAYIREDGVYDFGPSRFSGSDQ